MTDTLARGLQDIDPALRGVMLRLIREIDEASLDLAQLQQLQDLLKHLDFQISDRLNSAGGRD
ncbi:hypothetical protein [Amycolatopsis sp. 195334CR]|uniref:hypothetical protein n=1 Tax=Amycolatopsis sp. 195334CR TaxID=2814588 RepID=UPI001A90C118|nr:hypothetical protein [Amycolatopsis sp. 195334CR]MBN6034177.1 hypothetical protein [Amycolatopsis sp. 195334CR]